MRFIEQFKLQYIKLAEILGNVLIEYHATSTGLEMELNQVSESNWCVIKLKTKRIWSLLKLFFCNKVFLFLERHYPYLTYIALCVEDVGRLAWTKSKKYGTFWEGQSKRHHHYESFGVRNASFGFDATLESLMLAIKSSIHNVYCFSHNLFDVVLMVFKYVVFFKGRSWNIFKKWVLNFTLLFYGCYTSTTHNNDNNRLHLKQ